MEEMEREVFGARNSFGFRNDIESDLDRFFGTFERDLFPGSRGISNHHNLFGGDIFDSEHQSPIRGTGNTFPTNLGQ